MPKHILITGASGLVGSRLTQMLLAEGYSVSHLSRSSKPGKIPSFVWDVEKKYIDPEAFKGVDTIIHLAGAGVADKRWNEKHKKDILESRTHSSRLLFEKLNKGNHNVKNFISASAIGLYGFSLSDKLFTESSPAANDFLATVVKAWEDEVDPISTLNIRVVKIRIGIVLSKKGGALQQMAKPVKLGVGSPLASGKQYMSWIHIDDLCGLFIKAVEHSKMTGAYNGVAPVPITNEEMTKAIAKVLNRPLFTPNVPAFVLRIVVGEMAQIVINGSNISSGKAQDAGYDFKFKNIGSALNDFYQAIE
jgi:uncharacterized protein (TIGR01777 family)